MHLHVFDLQNCLHRSRIRRAVRTFLEWWYCHVMVGHNGNACLITFKVGPLRARTHTHTHTHTHLFHLSCHCWKQWRRVSFGIFHSLAVAFDLLSSIVAKRVPLRPIFRVWNNQKSFGPGSGEYGDWMLTGMYFSAKNYCTTSDVWLGILS
jgi:hypothetical protein